MLVIKFSGSYITTTTPTAEVDQALACNLPAHLPATAEAGLHYPH